MGNQFLKMLSLRMYPTGKGPNPQGISKNGWTMTGGITLYNSNSQFKNCSFENFNSEDALNIISSTFSLKNCIFSSHFSDAFDGDFVQGSIINCSFSNISGDGVDFSGSWMMFETAVSKIFLIRQFLSEKAVMSKYQPAKLIMIFWCSI